MSGRAGRTAWGPIIQVAIEQFVEDELRVVQDDFAYRMLPTQFRWMVDLLRIKALQDAFESRLPGMRGGIVCRRRYIDDRLSDASAIGIASVVTVGAGYDTRAIQQKVPKPITFYELDLPQNIAHKKKVLVKLLGEIPTNIRFVPIDLERQSIAGSMAQCGYTEQGPCFYIIEGVTQYLSASSVRQVFRYLAGAPCRSRLVFTYVLSDFLEGRRLYGLEVLYNQACIRKHAQTPLWQFALDPDAVDSFLAPYRWKKLEDIGSTDYYDRYLKPLNRRLSVMAIERTVYAERT